MLSKKFPFPIVKDGLLLVCLVNYLCCYKRAAALGRLNMTVKKHQIEVHTRFSIPDIREQFNNPKQQAEYLYSIIECEV